MNINEANFAAIGLKGGLLAIAFQGNVFNGLHLGNLAIGLPSGNLARASNGVLSIAQRAGLFAAIHQSRVSGTENYAGVDIYKFIPSTSIKRGMFYRSPLTECCPKPNGRECL